MTESIHQKRKLEPWPIAIAAFYGLFATFMIGFAVVISGENFDLVAPDYYAQTLTYEDHLAAVRRSAQLPAQPVIRVVEGECEVAFPEALRESVSEVELVWYRPDNAALDQTDALLVDEAGLSRSALPAPGSYKLTLKWKQGGLAYIVSRPQNVFGGGRP